MRQLFLQIGILFTLALANVLTAEPLLFAGGEKMDFSRDIAPIFQGRCIDCHGPSQAKSGLRLDQADAALRGGDSGAVIQPGKSAASRLIHVVSGTDKDEVVMPPEEPRLNAIEIGRLRAWIDQGAVWPKDVVLVAKQEQKQDVKRRHWSFQPLRRPPVPEVRNRDWVRNPIDNFILGRLEAEEISPSPEADPATLVRRLSLDLTGLPPSAELLRQLPLSPHPRIPLSKPDTESAYAALIDHLLASPHYGERWARPWLDLCHYGDTDGYLQDFPRPVAWRYRDWLIGALNRDLPFDQFTIEQLAGDLLLGATTDQKIATGFLRQTLSNREGGADLEEYRVEQVVDRTQMVATAWLGLTVGCARCHDHKYDPISQREFYQLYAFLDAADEVNIDAPLTGETEINAGDLAEYREQRRELLTPWEVATSELQSRWESKLHDAFARPGRDQTWDREWEVLGLVWGQALGEGQLEGTQIVLLDPARRTVEQAEKLQDYFLARGTIVDPAGEFTSFKPRDLAKQIGSLQSKLARPTRAPTVRETQNPRAVHLHVRGDFRRPGVRVSPATPAVLPPLAAGQVSPNRLDLARWIVTPENPLTARVAVNRVWQEFFGVGLTATSEDLGTQGERPTHPELLDWLAVEFRDRGWSVKALQRLIVTSATYRQSSKYRQELAARDPNNRLLARQASLRLSAEQVRDAALTVSGLLNGQLFGPSVRPPQPESVAMEAFDNKWIASEGSDRFRRGLYTFIQRTSPFAQGVIFDAPAASRVCTRRERSNTPLQALTLLNDPVFFEAAEALAAGIMKDAPREDRARIQRAYLICLSRMPSTHEEERLVAFLDQERLASGSDHSRSEAAERNAWTTLASVLLNLHEFITRD